MNTIQIIILYVLIFLVFLKTFDILRNKIPDKFKDWHFGVLTLLMFMSFVLQLNGFYDWLFNITDKEIKISQLIITKMFNDNKWFIIIGLISSIFLIIPNKK